MLEIPTKPISLENIMTTTLISKNAETIASVLDKHNVFDFPEDHADLIFMIERHAKSNPSEPLEITYHRAQVRLFIRFGTVDGERCVWSVKTAEHPHSAVIDFDSLRSELDAIKP